MKYDKIIKTVIIDLATGVVFFYITRVIVSLLTATGYDYPDYPYAQLLIQIAMILFVMTAVIAVTGNRIAREIRELNKKHNEELSDVPKDGSK